MKESLKKKKLGYIPKINFLAYSVDTFQGGWAAGWMGGWVMTVIGDYKTNSAPLALARLAT